MTQEEQKHLIIGIVAGAIVMYLYVNRKKPIAADSLSSASPATLTVSDYGNPVVVANGGQLNTLVGMRSPAQLTYHDFNMLLDNPNDALKGFSQQDVIMEQQRAMSFLNEIGWLTRFEEYESELTNPKIEDPIIFALHLGAGFRLFPPLTVSAPVAVVNSAV